MVDKPDLKVCIVSTAQVLWGKKVHFKSVFKYNSDFKFEVHIKRKKSAMMQIYVLLNECCLHAQLLYVMYM